MIDAKEYGKAIFLLAEEEGTTEAVMSDLTLVCDVMRKNPKYETLLDTPALSVQVRLGLIEEAFASLDENAKNLLKLLTEKHEMHKIKEIVKTACALYDEARGILRVTAVTAVSMTKKQRTALSAKLQEQTGKTIMMENIVDSSILGGVVLRYAGVQLDGSVKTRLDTLQKSLKELVL